MILGEHWLLFLQKISPKPNAHDFGRFLAVFPPKNLLKIGSFSALVFWLGKCVLRHVKKL